MRLKRNYYTGEWLYGIIVAFLLFYSYNTTFQYAIFGSRAVAVLCVLFACGAGIVIQKFTLPKKFDIWMFWYLLAFLSLFNNQDLLQDTQTRWLLPMAGIATILLLLNHTGWQTAFRGVVRFWVLFHAFFTIFFYIFQDFYLNSIVPLMPGTHEYLIKRFTEGSMAGLTAHYSTNGIYLGFGFMFFVTDVITNKAQTLKGKIKDCVLLVFVLAALILTTKRAHILFAAAATVVVFFVYYSNNNKFRWTCILGGGAAGLALFLIGAQFIPALANVLRRFVDFGGGEITNGRIWFWEYALEQFKEHPIFGLGWGGFKHSYFTAIGHYSSTSQYVDTHNTFLQILCEQGIVGILLFAGAVFGTFFITWKRLQTWRKTNASVPAEWTYRYALSLGIQAFFIFYCVTGNCLYDCEAFFVYILSCAMVYSLERKIDAGYLDRRQVGLLTFHQVMNYGAVLQCYGLKKMVESFGHVCEVIPHSCRKLKNNEKLIKLNKKLPVYLAKFASQGWGTLRKRLGFNAFLWDYCGMDRVEGPADYKPYDSVVVGSDQVWNLNLTAKDYTYFLEKPDNLKKIAYAASFGESDVPASEKERMLKAVEGFHAVSIREQAGQRWLAENGVPSTAVCDPVLLWGAENWINMVKDRKFREKKPYVLVYCVEKSATVFEYAKRIGKEKGLPVLYLNQNLFFKEKGLQYRRGVSPLQFLQYLYHADFVVTNSFHGTAFSIMFEKQFATDAIWHGKTNIRVDSLLQMTQLQHRRIQDIAANDYKDVYTPVDFLEARERLAAVRAHSKAFLETALNGKDGE